MQIKWQFESAPVIFKPTQRKNLEGARHAVRAVLYLSGDFQDLEDNFPIIEKQIAKKATSQNFPDLI